jgi:hypothetical protein
MDNLQMPTLGYVTVWIIFWFGLEWIKSYQARRYEMRIKAKLAVQLTKAYNRGLMSGFKLASKHYRLAKLTKTEETKSDPESV